MKASVNHLLDMEHRARQMLGDAQQYYDRILQEIKTEQAKLRESYEERARDRIEQVRLSENNQLDETVDEINRHSDKLLEELEALHRQRHEEWEDTLFRRCIHGEGDASS